MSVHELTENTIDRYFTHIKNNASHPFVRSVLNKKTSFQKEVENYYDLWVIELDRGPNKREFCLGNEDSNKIKEKPNDLVALLSIFAEDSFDVSKLDYSLVRADCGNWNEPAGRYMRRSFSFFFGIAGMSVSIAYSSVDLLTAIVGGLTSFALAAYSGTSYEPKRTNNESKEFLKLYECAGIADNNINNHRV